VSAWINMEIAPRCRVAYREMLIPVMAQTSLLLPEKTYIRHFTNSIVYVSKVRGTNLEDVFICTLSDNKVDSYIRAERGTFHFEPVVNQLTVRLINFNRISLAKSGDEPQPSNSGDVEMVYPNVVPKITRRIDSDNMTFSQLQAELRAVEQALGTAVAPGRPGADAMREKMRQLTTQRRPDVTMPLHVQMHRQAAFSFACIGFTLVGIPLGIRAHRRETTFGIAIALILVLIYHSFFVLGQSLDTRPDLAPHLILWLPNFLFQAVGIVLLWRANRGL